MPKFKVSPKAADVFDEMYPASCLNVMVGGIGSSSFEQLAIKSEAEIRTRLKMENNFFMVL
jgi:hypothetical protein